jgi:hypothetical protein
MKMVKGIVRVVRYLGIVACCVLGFVTIVATGGGGGGDGAGGVPGLTFNQANMVDSAGLGAGMTEIFPGISEVTIAVVGSLAEEPPRTGDLDLCLTGTSVLAWVDGDENNTLTAGDTAILTFTDCDLDGQGGQLDGTANFSFTSIDDVNLSGVAMVTFDLQSQELVDGILERENFSGRLRLELITQDGTNYTALFGGADRDDVITFSMNGQEVAKFGCFDVEQTFSIDPLDPVAPDAYTLAPRGIANVGGQIMQIGSYWGPDQLLDFQPGFSPEPVPVSGTLTYLSFDGRNSAPASFGGLSACSAVGSFGDVSTDNSSLLLTATGGGAVRLELYNNLDLIPPVLATVETTWQALMD